MIGFCARPGIPPSCGGTARSETAWPHPRFARGPPSQRNPRPPQTAKCNDGQERPRIDVGKAAPRGGASMRALDGVVFHVLIVQRPERRLGSIFDAQFPQQALDVLLDSLHADLQTLGNLFVFEAGGNEVEHVSFTLGQFPMKKRSIRARGGGQCPPGVIVFASTPASPR